MWTRAVLAGLVSAVVALALRPAVSAQECDELDLRFKGLPGATVSCEVHGIGGDGDSSATSEMIQVFGSRFVLIVSHASAGHRTYLIRLTVKELMRNSRAFASIDEWGDEAESGEFFVRRFNGKFFDGARTACFGFARYSGHVARTTGYRHLIRGFYCDIDEVAPTDGRISEVLGSLEYSF